jgi:hypothetical protein
MRHRLPAAPPRPPQGPRRRHAVQRQDPGVLHAARRGVPGGPLQYLGPRFHRLVQSARLAESGLCGPSSAGLSAGGSPVGPSAGAKPCGPGLCGPDPVGLSARCFPAGLRAGGWLCGPGRCGPYTAGVWPCGSGLCGPSSAGLSAGGSPVRPSAGAWPCGPGLCGPSPVGLSARCFPAGLNAGEWLCGPGICGSSTTRLSAGGRPVGLSAGVWLCGQRLRGPSLVWFSSGSVPGCGFVGQGFMGPAPPGSGPGAVSPGSLPETTPGVGQVPFLRGTALPTAKAAREAENTAALGGLRNPNFAVAKSPGLQAVGARIRRIAEDFGRKAYNKDIVRKVYGSLAPRTLTAFQPPSSKSSGPCCRRSSTWQPTLRD